MIYFVVPIVCTLLATSGLWENFFKDRTQKRFDAAADATLSSLLACSATSFTLWQSVNIEPEVHWLDTPWAWLLVPVVLSISAAYHWRSNRRT